jgi:hypothetical protein
MKAKDNGELIYQALAELADMRRLLSNLQSSPTITGRAAALVALAKDSRLDGRIGAGDVVVSVMLAAGGASIGIIGAAGIKFGAVDLMSTGEAFGYCTTSGCILGLGRMALDALAVPMMMSNGLDWLAERWQEWLEHREEIATSQPESTREIPVFNRGEPAGFVSMPEPTEFKVNTLKIESVNMVDGIREIAVDKVCLFLKNAAATGQWARDRQDILSQKEHPDVKRYLQGRGWWEIATPLAIQACAELRGGVTNGTERNERNGRTE